MSYEVDVVEIKTKKIAFKHTAEEMRFIEHYSPNKKLRTDEGEFLIGPAAVDELASYDIQSRQAMRIRSDRGNDKYIIWSPEFEEFVGNELSWINDLRDDNINLESEICKLRDDNRNLESEICKLRDDNRNLGNKLKFMYLLGSVIGTMGFLSIIKWWLL
jgi:hypothetical protein